MEIFVPSLLSVYEENGRLYQLTLYILHCALRFVSEDRKTQSYCVIPIFYLLCK